MTIRKIPTTPILRMAWNKMTVVFHFILRMNSGIATKSILESSEEATTTNFCISQLYTHLNISRHHYIPNNPTVMIN
uniref:Secreted protein n=1 Tax=Panagrellus redivivus TaxID=6233 RepID=A0A7E4VP21_PANRE